MGDDYSVLESRLKQLCGDSKGFWNQHGNVLNFLTISASKLS